MKYSKLVEALAARIKGGELRPGTRLQTHRAFAEEHGVALATATRVYNSLKQRGLIVGESGRGMFVRQPEVPPTLGIEQHEEAPPIDLVFNMPGDPGDGEVLRAALRGLAGRGDLNALLRYQPHGGVLAERRVIANYLSPRLGRIEPERLFITSGAQHGLSVVAFGLLERGDGIATDHLTYPGFRAAVGLRDLGLHPVSAQNGHMDPLALLRLCAQRRLRAVYLMPTVHNPLGTVMDDYTRRAIVAIARHHDLLIFEDGAYDFLETDPPPSFLELAPERTIYIGGVSKILATGLRLGYVIVPPDLAGSVTMAIRATTWNTPALVTALVTQWIEDGTIRQFEQARRAAGARMQAICRSCLGPHRVSAHRNAGFAWLPLPGGMRSEQVVARLADEGIAVSTAEPYAVGPVVPDALRLAFGGLDQEVLRTGLATIRAVLDAG